MNQDKNTRSRSSPSCDRSFTCVDGIWMCWYDVLIDTCVDACLSFKLIYGWILMWKIYLWMAGGMFVWTHLANYEFFVGRMVFWMDTWVFDVLLQASFNSQIFWRANILMFGCYKINQFCRHEWIFYWADGMKQKRTDRPFVFIYW